MAAGCDQKSDGNDKELGYQAKESHRHRPQQKRRQQRRQQQQQQRKIIIKIHRNNTKQQQHQQHQQSHPPLMKDKRPSDTRRRTASRLSEPCNNTNQAHTTVCLHARILCERVCLHPHYSGHQSTTYAFSVLSGCTSRSHTEGTSHRSFFFFSLPPTFFCGTIVFFAFHLRIARRVQGSTVPFTVVDY